MPNITVSLAELLHQPLSRHRASLCSSIKRCPLWCRFQGLNSDIARLPRWTNLRRRPSTQLREAIRECGLLSPLRHFSRLDLGQEQRAESRSGRRAVDGRVFLFAKAFVRKRRKFPVLENGFPVLSPTIPCSVI